MLKNCLAGVLLSMAIMLNVQAGNPSRISTNSIPESQIVKKPATASDSESRIFYLKAGVSVPVGRFGLKPSLTRSGIASFNGKDGTGGTTGLNAEAGIAYFVNIPALPEKVKIGLDIGIGFASNKIDWTSLGLPGEFANTPFYFFNVKAGPVVSYAFTGNVIAEAFLKLNPVGSRAGVVSYSEGTYKGTIGGQDEMAFGLKQSMGMNLRYKIFQVGAELNWGRIEYKIKEAYSTGGGNPYTVRTPTSALQLTAGVRL